MTSSRRAFTVALLMMAAFLPLGQGVEVCNIIKTQYDTLIRTGDSKGSEYAYGQLMTKDYKPIANQDGKLRISNQPDYTSFHLIGDEMYVLSQTESPSPGGMFLMQVVQDPDTGALDVVEGSVKPIDFSSIEGLWVPCSGVTTKWNSHIGGEEYEPDARAFAEADCVFISQCGNSSWEALVGDEFFWSKNVGHLLFYGIEADNSTTMSEVREVYNPYNYGFAVEVSLKENGNYTVERWYTLGRIARELAYVMPDNRTIYSTDDGDNVGFFKFIADAPADFSSGTLYAAKVNETSDVGGGSFDIEWIELGSATQEELKAMKDNLTFDAIFDTAEGTENGTCPSGYTSINAGSGASAGFQCLKLKPGMETAAAFFESRRYAAYLGATTEFSKWEGLVYSPKRNTIYTSMSEIRRGMEDNKKSGEDNNEYDLGGPNSIKLDYNPCGCVYTMEVDGDYNIASMSALICGTYQDNALNFCELDGIANPDNLAIMDDQNQLLILEDTIGGHQNDFAWAYDLDDGSLVRILTSPYGSEVTGGWWYPDMNEWAYLVTIIQHPYNESDQMFANASLNPYYEGDEGYLGYWTFPAAQVADADVTFKSISYPSNMEQKSKERGTKSMTACITCGDYNGTYRFESESCPGRYISASASCDDTSIMLGSRLDQSGPGTDTRDWKINGSPNEFMAFMSEARASSCATKVMASDSNVSMGDNTTGNWEYKIVPTESCHVVNLRAKSGDGKGKFLAVTTDCSGFAWVTDGSEEKAKWNMIEQQTA